MSDVKTLVKNRRSIRSYRNQPVEEETLHRILEHALLAPSAKNRQEWKIILVKEEQQRRRLAQACDSQKFMFEAPVHLVFVSTLPRTLTCGMEASLIDTSILVTYVMLLAQDEGLGTCWLGRFFQDEVKEVLQIPKEWSVIAVMSLGYPDEQPQARPRKSMKEVIIEERVSL